MNTTRPALTVVGIISPGRGERRGGDVVGDPSSQLDLAHLGHYVERTAAASGVSS